MTGETERDRNVAVAWPLSGTRWPRPSPQPSPGMLVTYSSLPRGPISDILLPRGKPR
jgi:hypothetical protein